MPEIHSAQNLNAHYSNNAKVIKKSKTPALAPNSLPKHHLYNDIDANDRMNAINQDIYNLYKNEKKSNGKNFIKIFCGIIIAILTALGLKKVFKKS